MVLKVTFCTGAIKSSNLCWWTWVIISVRICLASTHYKLFKHHHYGHVICGILMSLLKSALLLYVRFWLTELHPIFPKISFLWLRWRWVGWEVGLCLRRELWRQWPWHNVECSDNSLSPKVTLFKVTVLQTQTESLFGCTTLRSFSLWVPLVL